MSKEVYAEEIEAFLERLEPFLKLEALGQAEAFKGPELAEGLRALRQRRAPSF